MPIAPAIGMITASAIPVIRVRSKTPKLFAELSSAGSG
jgi:hypothetical protein